MVFRIEASQLGLDPIKFADPLHAVLGNRCGPIAGDLHQFAAGMRPAIGKPNVRSDTLRRDQSIVSGIAVNLQNAGESLQYPFCMLSPATGRIGEGNARGSSAAPWTIISRQSPEVSGFGLTGSGIEHRSSGLVHEELARTFQV